MGLFKKLFSKKEKRSGLSDSILSRGDGATAIPNSDNSDNGYIPNDDSFNDIECSKELFEQIREKAESGNALCMTDLGMLYLYGKGTSVNVEKGLLWLKKAADKKDSMGMHNLGTFYMIGKFVQKDLGNAVYYFREASEQQFGRSTNVLGVMAEKGEGMPQDYVKAKSYYELAIKQGEGLACENLALLYMNGNGTEKDLIKAAQYFQEAIDKESITEEGISTFNWLLLKLYCDGIDYFLGFTQRTSEEDAYKNIRISSLYGFAPATKFLLLNHYAHNLPIMGQERHIVSGNSFPQIDYVEKTILNIRNFDYSDIKETEKGIEREEADELCYGALLVLFGVLSMPNVSHVYLLKKSIQKGFVTAWFWLGYCYEKGLGLKKSVSDAETCYLHLIKEGNPQPLWGSQLVSDNGRELAESYYRLALIRYESGNYKPNDIKSMLSFKYGNNLFHSQSMMLYAKCLIDDGKQIEDSEVKQLINTCAQLKNDEALFMLAKYYDSIKDDKNCCKYCMEAVNYGSIDAVKMFLEKSSNIS